MIMAEHFS